MNISLTVQLNRFVKKQVESGRYASASEVVRDALRLLDEKCQTREHRIKELRREIKKGSDQISRGEYVTITKENLGDFFDDIKRRGRERLAARKNRNG